MNQSTQTPRTDACESTPDRGGIRARTWKVTRLVDTSRTLERENATMQAALERIAALAFDAHDRRVLLLVIQDAARAALAQVTP